MDKVFAHTDIDGLFITIDKKVLENLKTVIFDLYELHCLLLNEIPGKNDSKSMIARTQPTTNEYSNQSKDKATLLKKLFLLTDIPRHEKAKI